MQEEFKVGDLVRRTIASHYTNHKKSDAIGVILKLMGGPHGSGPLAKVYFYDTKKNEVWNRKALKKVKKGMRDHKPREGNK